MAQPKVSRPVSHCTQRQSYVVKMESKIMFNPQNKLLRKGEEAQEYEGTFSLSIAGKGVTITDKMHDGENFTDMMNRVGKIAAYKLLDTLFPTDRAKELKPKKSKKP